MAHDIKKRSASHIYFGVHSESGEIMHISKVPSGQKCNCVCAACGQPFEARKGSIRRHHFAHVSNYECMYASEVAIYKALAAELEKTDCLTLPPVMLRFPAWSKDELLQNAKTVRVDSVEFKCEPLAYPPLLTIKAQGSAYASSLTSTIIMTVRISLRWLPRRRMTVTHCSSMLCRSWTRIRNLHLIAL